MFAASIGVTVSGEVIKTSDIYFAIPVVLLLPTARALPTVSLLLMMATLSILFSAVGTVTHVIAKH